MFKVIAVEATATGSDYYIKNTSTDEVRVLRDCVCFDSDVFDDYDFETECEAV